MMALTAFGQTETKHLLPTMEGGPWECLYYLPNTNTDLNAAVKAKWYATTEDESDWAKGHGPFSSERDAFFYTPWGSSLRPLLVRRHFTLTEEDLASIKSVKLLISYDENPKVYLNGTQIYSASGWSDSNYATMTLTSSQRKKLVEGDNVIAVSLMQGGGSGHLDFGLDITFTPTAIGEVTEEKAFVPTTVYNLAGYRVEQMQRGVNIVNGKKIIKE